MLQTEPIPAIGRDGDADATFAHLLESRRAILLTLALIAAVVWTLIFFSFTVDDAFISFRYGKNLALHHVWNWNPYGTPEEAYTSAVYTVIAILPAILHLPTVLFMKLVGLACVGVMVYRLVTLSSSRLAVLLGLLLVTLGPVVWMQIYAGLEAPLYMLLILEMSLAASRPDTTPPAWVYALFLLLPLTRPEGILFACAGVLLYWQGRRQSSRQLPLFGLSLLLGLTYFVARWHHFHNLLPNPFYVKVVQDNLRDTLALMATAAAQYKGYLFALTLVALLAKRTVPRVMSLCSLLLLLLLFAPHDMAMNFGDRYYVQLTLPILLLFLITENIPRVSRFAAAITILFVLAFSPGEVLWNVKYSGSIKRAHYDLGRRLAPFAAGHTMILPDVGGIPYYSGWFAYDLLGLGTNSIARNGITVASLQQMHPDLVVLYNQSPGPSLLQNKSYVGGSEATGRTLVNFLNQSGQYQYAASSKVNGFYLVEFLRKDTPQHDQILAALQQNDLNSQIPLSLKQILLQRYLP
jgi:arabinofuranosyltransferase